jgi:hypothetical protein
VKQLPRNHPVKKWWFVRNDRALDVGGIAKIAAFSQVSELVIGVTECIVVGAVRFIA